MKKWNRICAMLLALLMALGLMTPLSAADAPSVVTAAVGGDCYVYPYASSYDASVVKGGSIELKFLRSPTTPHEDDVVCVAIVRGSTDQFEEETLPELVESHMFAPGQALTMTWQADERYDVGDYSLAAFAMSASGEYYDQRYYYIDLHVVEAPVPSTGMEFCRLDGGSFTYTIPSRMDLNETLCLTPALLPYETTDALDVSVTSSDPETVRAEVIGDYIYLSSGGKIGPADVTVRCGSYTKTYPVMFGAVQEVTLSPESLRLCVGKTATLDYRVTTAQGEAKLIWETSDPGVVAVTDGVLTAVAPGTATVTMTAADMTRSLSCTVDYHSLPADAQVYPATATQPGRIVGHCSVCGDEQATVITAEPMFTDTLPGAWYAAYVDDVFEIGIMNGVGDHSFAPDKPMTRGMAAAVLYRIAGAPEVSEACPFTDVPQTSYYAKAISWAQKNKIVTGYPDQSFHPEENITRQQFAAILYRFAKATGAEPGAGGSLSAFPDAGAVQPWALEAMQWAVGDGLISGVAVNGVPYLRPDANTTRAQFAAIISRCRAAGKLN